MKYFILIFSLALPVAAQTTHVSGNSHMGGSARLGNTARYNSFIMGLNEFNSSLPISSNNLNAQQFVYSQFQQQANLTHASADGCSASYNGSLYVIGGYGTSDTNYLNYIQIFNPLLNAWTQGATMPTAAWGMGCAVYNGKIYTFGGATLADGNTNGTTLAQVYDIAGNSWSSLTALPTALKNGTMAITVGSFVYIKSGALMYRFDPSGGTYTSLTAPPSAQQNQWSVTGYVNVSGDDRIYYITGCTSSSVCSNVNYYYSVTNNTWSSAQAVAPYAARGQVQNTSYNGKIYALGGFDQTYFYNDLYAYDPVGNSWSSALATMNTFRDGVMGGFIGGTIYAAGGRYADTFPYGLVATESFQIGSTPTAVNFTKIQVNFTGSPSGNVRMGIYSDSSGLPGSLVLDAGQVAMASGWVSIGGLNQALTPGTRYWLVSNQSSTQSQSYVQTNVFNPSAANSYCFASSAFGAMPGTFPASPTCDNTHMFAMKLTVN